MLPHSFQCNSVAWSSVRCRWLFAIIVWFFLRALKFMEIGLKRKGGGAAWNSEALQAVPVLSTALLCCCSPWYLRGEKSIRQLYLQLCILDNKTTVLLGAIDQAPRLQCVSGLNKSILIYNLIYYSLGFVCLFIYSFHLFFFLTM